MNPILIALPNSDPRIANLYWDCVQCPHPTRDMVMHMVNRAYPKEVLMYRNFIELITDRMMLSIKNFDMHTNLLQQQNANN